MFCEIKINLFPTTRKLHFHSPLSELICTVLLSCCLLLIDIEIVFAFKILWLSFSVCFRPFASDTLGLLAAERRYPRVVCVCCE